jgi:hypothetical protein
VSEFPFKSSKAYIYFYQTEVMALMEEANDEHETSYTQKLQLVQDMLAAELGIQPRAN